MKPILSVCFALLALIRCPVYAQTTTKKYFCEVVDNKSGGFYLGKALRVYVEEKSRGVKIYKMGLTNVYPGATEEIELGVAVDPDHSALVRFESNGYFARELRQSVLIWNDNAVGVCN